MFETIPATGSFKVPPDPAGAARTFARIGYDLGQAIADLIDNSVDAEASRIAVIFHRDGNRVLAVSVVDDGKGMDQAALEAAMRIGAQGHHKDSDLGTFGSGLKLASMSQSKTLSVISRRNRVTAACRWSKEAVGTDWTCEWLAASPASVRLDALADDLVDVARKGTAVLWERLERLSVAQADMERFLSKTLDGLEVHLGLHFHRFLSSGKLEIVLTTRNVDGSLGLQREVPPYDPFGYSRTGHKDYPRLFAVSIEGLGELQAEAHIWPPEASDRNFKLGRRTGTQHQGLYFYRNDRLIQANGWHGFLKDDADPELGLARVRIDLPASSRLDLVNVQKSALQITASVSEAFGKAKSGGATLHDYVEASRKVFRHGLKNAKAQGDLPLVPGDGLPVGLRRDLVAMLSEGDLLQRPIDFEWTALGKKKIFDLHRTDDKIFLNQNFRAKILGGKRGSATDAPLLKVLLFLLLQDEFGRERLSQKRRQWIDRCNAILLKAVRAL